MALVWDVHYDESVELEEFMDYVHNNADPHDEQSFMDCRHMLRKLANNRSFVIDKYHEKLKNFIDGGEQALSQTQSLEVAAGADFYVRANIWLPIAEDSLTATFQKKLFSYDLPHDHNFSFLTVGYFGEGYETDIYEYQNEKCHGYVNEEIDLKHLGRHKLTPGRMIFYRSSRDIHIQYWPETLSVSVNLMPNIKNVPSQQQYIFDLQNQLITGGAGDLISNKLFLFKAAGYIGDETTVELLADISQSDTSCAKTRAMALRSIDKIDPKAAEFLHRKVPRHICDLSRKDIVCGSQGRDYMA